MTVAIAAWTADGDSNDSFGLVVLLTTDNLDTRRRCWCCESDWLDEPPSCEEGVADKEAAEDDELSAERLDPANNI